jgi:hypothetical protein
MNPKGQELRADEPMSLFQLRAAGSSSALTAPVHHQYAE